MAIPFKPKKQQRPPDERLLFWHPMTNVVVPKYFEFNAPNIRRYVENAVKLQRLTTQRLSGEVYDSKNTTYAFSKIEPQFKLDYTLEKAAFLTFGEYAAMVNGVQRKYPMTRLDLQIGSFERKPLFQTFRVGKVITGTNSLHYVFRIPKQSKFLTPLLTYWLKEVECVSSAYVKKYMDSVQMWLKSTSKKKKEKPDDYQAICIETGKTHRQLTVTKMTKAFEFSIDHKSPELVIDPGEQCETECKFDHLHWVAINFMATQYPKSYPALSTKMTHFMHKPLGDIVL